MTDLHVTDDMLARLRDGSLTQQECIGALNHIGECTACAERFASLYAPDAMAPPELAEAVLGLGGPAGVLIVSCYSLLVQRVRCVPGSPPTATASTASPHPCTPFPKKYC